MDAITKILDGNIYRVYDVQVSDIQPSESNTSFDSVYNSVFVSDDTDLEALFNEASSKTGVDAALIKAVAQAESGFDTDAVSSCGAMGIMQLMPSTCSGYGVTDPFDAEQNILAGARVLSDMLDRYDGNVTLALAAYNSGYGNVDKYGGVPPFSETKSYIDKVTGIMDSYTNTQISDDIYKNYANGYNRFL